MKKKIVFLLLFLLTILFSACFTPKEYSITYYLDGEIVELEPNKYEVGLETKLPEVDSQYFNGWYTNKDLNGNKYILIDSDKRGDLTFYAITKPDAATFDEIVRNSKNYDCTLTIASNGNNKVTKYSNRENIYKANNNYYLYDNNANGYVYVFESQNNKYGLKKNSTIFEYVILDNVFLMLEQLGKDAFIENENVFKLDKTKRTK